MNKKNSLRYPLLSSWHFNFGVPINFHEIEKHLRLIAQKKKFAKHVIVGDFNFNRTIWPEGQSSDKTERLFLDLFGDLGHTQMSYPCSQ